MDTRRARPDPDPDTARVEALRHMLAEALPYVMECADERDDRGIQQSPELNILIACILKEISK